MALRPLIYIGDEILRMRAQRTHVFGPELHQLLDDMLETMLAEGGIGLAAPQVGISQRVIIVRLPDDEESVPLFGDQAGLLYEAINPKIIRESPEMLDGIEGCLSIPGYLGTVPRHAAAIIRAQDRHGQAIRIKTRGWLARVFQHEMDHLAGALFIDRATEVWRADERVSEDVLVG
jgi:peptide deformylase